MRNVTVSASREYDIMIGRGLLQSAGGVIASRLNPRAAVLVGDDITDALYGGVVARSLENAGIAVKRWSFPHGEGSKSIRTLNSLLEFMAQSGIDRTDIAVALGGGVVGDMTGFAAAVYMRGIRYVQMPTTLLAAVDSSVGGKTAVDLDAGKNLAGVFWQPSLVLCDCSTFKTLTTSLFADGAAEGIKYGVLCDEALFGEFRNGGYHDAIEDVVARCVSIKAELVKGDEFDTGSRQLLNFGHTVGHAIERCSYYTVSHGSAVATGMLIETRAAEAMGYTKEACSTRLEEALESLRLPTSTCYTPERLAAAACLDKKRSGDFITLALPERLGHCSLFKLPVEGLREFIQAGME